MKPRITLEFGLTRGNHRLLGITKKQGIQTSVVDNGVFCERKPQTALRSARAGHERRPRVKACNDVWTSKREPMALYVLETFSE